MEQPAVLATLLVVCPDRRGIVAALAQVLSGHGANILDSDQHTDPAAGMFFQRIRFDLSALMTDRLTLERAIAEVGERFGMTYRLLYVERPKRPATRQQQEHAELELLERERIDLVVLARYMQILGADLVSRYTARIINIHHSFLPAFVGGRPYHQAYERGVKLIGATAHYATPNLDEGPIIEQDVVRASHKDSVEDLARKGRDLEKVVLARAVRLHLDDRVLVYGNKTVVFD